MVVRFKANLIISSFISFFLFSCKSENLFTKDQLRSDITLKIINAWFEKYEYYPSNFCHQEALKVNDTLLWRHTYYGEQVQEVLDKNNIILDKEPALISKMETNLPEFFRKNVTLVNAIDDSGYCMIYSFSPAIKTRNPNEYIIQISSYSFELDTDLVLLVEFVGNQIEIKEELLMEMVWF